MALLYAERWSETVDASHSKYVFSDRVKSGHVLHVNTCFCHAPERDANDIIKLGVRNGGTDILIRSRAGAIAKEGMSSLRDFNVGEHDRVFAYFPDAENDDTIELHIAGCLRTLEEWRASVE